MVDSDSDITVRRRALLVAIGLGSVAAVVSILHWDDQDGSSPGRTNTTETMSDSQSSTLSGIDYPIRIAENYVIGTADGRPAPDEATGVIWEVVAPDAGTVRRTISDGEAWKTLNVETDVAETGQLNRWTFVSPADDLVSAVSGASSGEMIFLLPGEHTPESPLTLPRATRLHVSAGATLLAPTLEAEQRFVRIRNDNCALTGRGVIDGNRNGDQPLDSRGQEHIVDVRSDGDDVIRDCLLEGPHLRQAPGGDCLYINGARNMVARNFVAEGGYRNGVSIIDASAVTLKRFVVRDAAGTPPESGIVVEPNGDTHSIRGLEIGGFESTANGRNGLVINTERLSPQATTTINIRDGRCTDNGWDGVRLTRAVRGTRILFHDCLAHENGGAGFNLGAATNTYLYGTEASNNGQTRRRETEPVGYLAGSFDGESASGLHVVNAVARDDQSQPTQTTPMLVRGGANVTVSGMRIGAHSDDARIRLEDGQLRPDGVFSTESNNPIRAVGGRVLGTACYPRVVSHSERPTPGPGELVVWDPADGDGNHVLVYNDSGTVFTIGRE